MKIYVNELFFAFGFITINESIHVFTTSLN